MKIKLTENKLKQIVAESVKRVLNEIGSTPEDQYALGAVAGRGDARQRYMPYNEYIKKNKGYGKGGDSEYKRALDTATKKYRENDPRLKDFFRGYHDYFEKERQELMQKYPNGEAESPATNSYKYLPREWGRR